VLCHIKDRKALERRFTEIMMTQADAPLTNAMKLDGKIRQNDGTEDDRKPGRRGRGVVEERRTNGLQESDVRWRKGIKTLRGMIIDDV
jgi:hypothetical protein